MHLFLRSLRFRVIAASFALIALWLSIALIGTVLNARQRVAAEAKASAALARALINAVSASSEDPAVTLREVEKQLSPARHVRLGISSSQNAPAGVEETISSQESLPAPSWFMDLVAAKQSVEIVNTSLPGNMQNSFYIISSPSDEIREVWQEFRLILAFCALLAALIAGSLLWMSAYALRPIRKLGEGLERLGRSDFNATLAPFGFSELEQIRGQFNNLSHSLRNKTAENEKLYQRLVSMQESERTHVARELHDELGPCLFAIRAETASILQTLGRSEAAPSLIGERARAINGLVDAIQHINRRILHTVQPATLSERGLAAALRALVDGWQDTYPKITWSLDFIDGDLEEVSQELSLAVYRVVQEGLTNIARHSRCSEAGVKIAKAANYNGQTLQILVTDNGEGFELRPGSGSGIEGMRQRIHNLGGIFILETATGRGVSINASIPLGAQA